MPVLNHASGTTNSHFTSPLAGSMARIAPNPSRALVASFPRRDVVHGSRGTEGCRMPVCCAQAGRNPFRLWRLRKRRAPARVETGEPIDADERLAQQELARQTVDEVHQ